MSVHEFGIILRSAMLFPPRKELPYVNVDMRTVMFFQFQWTSTIHVVVSCQHSPGMTPICKCISVPSSPN